jgi:hypothetical protein
MPQAKRPLKGGKKRGVSFAAVRKWALALPGVEDGLSYGTPALKVRGKFITRLREEDHSLVFILGSIDERDFLLQADPRVFFITEHYRNYPDVLVRLDTVRPSTVREMLEQAWRRVAPRRLVAAFDAA